MVNRYRSLLLIGLIGPATALACQDHGGGFGLWARFQHASYQEEGYPDAREPTASEPDEAEGFAPASKAPAAARRPPTNFQDSARKRAAAAKQNTEVENKPLR